MSAECTLSILVARPDVPFMEKTIPHLVRMCRHPFADRMLVVDTAPLAPRYTDKPGLATHEELLAACERLKLAGVVDKYVSIHYTPENQKRLYQKHFGRYLRETANFRGYPILGSMYAYELAKTDYFLHFDSDMLLYQKEGHDWITQGMQKLQECPQALVAGPLAGPPPDQAGPHQPGVKIAHDARGFYQLDFFTSRRYLFYKPRFDEFLPMPPRYISWKRRLWAQLFGGSALWNWEVMVSRYMNDQNMFRLDLDSPHAWTLHTPDHGPRFLEHLDSIIQKVETGQFPASQAGDYDLKLDDWITFEPTSA